MDVSAIAKIRDTRGLTTNEKMFLITVASHKDGMFRTHEKNYEDMGLSKATYYRVRGDLDKKLIEVQRRFDNSTVYGINGEELDAWCLSHVETPKSLSETRKSPRETPESHCAETKDNLKDNLTKNPKDNRTGSADAPPVVPNKKNPHAPAARPDNLSYSTSSSALEEVGSMEQTTPGESHSETFVPKWRRRGPETEEEQVEALRAIKAARQKRGSATNRVAPV